jgi:SAM-dependent methyltransferase
VSPTGPTASPRTSDYDREFFEDHVHKARTSAETIVPLVMELVEPTSVVDLGCGLGTWLATFERHGISDYVGVDGDWVPREAMEIPADRFVPARLDEALELGRQFDLAVSLEVAEHLPERVARRFVETATGLAPVVLFSAAIPHQGGLHHMNEQWPEYWAALFAAEGYALVDSIRPLVWSTPGVSFWYAQNAFLYVRTDVLAERPGLARARDATRGSMLSPVHPSLLLQMARAPEEHVRRPSAREHSFRDLIDALPRVASRSLAWRVQRVRRRERNG